MSAPRLLAGDGDTFAELARALADPARAGARVRLVADRPGRRRLQHVVLASGEALLVKRFPASRPRRRVGEGLKRASALTAPRREARALARLGASGVPVPEVRALGVLADGDTLLATRHRSGGPLAAALAGTGAAERRALLGRVAAAVASLHAAGWVHGDLHAGNVWITAQGPLLLDLQAARRSRGRRARARDLGALDHSLVPGLPATDRLRLAAAALGLVRPPPGALRSFPHVGRRHLAAVWRASAARGRDRARSRTRRALVPGRRFAPFAARGLRGLRARDVPEAALRDALAARGRILDQNARTRVTAVAAGGRRFVVKEYAPRGLLRRTADRIRGSPARRAWRGGHGLLARRIGAARPVAYLDPALLVLEDLSAWCPADVAAAELAGADEVTAALARLALALHRAGASHRDLKASHVRLARAGRGLRARLLDLEDVRFPGRAGDRLRLRALAQLNASLPDTVSAPARRAAFEAYAAGLPFRWLATDTAMRRVVAASLGRAHRWSGADCQLAETTSQRK